MQLVCADRQTIDVDADAASESDRDPTYDMIDEGSALNQPTARTAAGEMQGPVVTDA